MSSIAAGTIIAKNFLSFARVVARSFQDHHPGIPFYTLLVDEPDGFFDPDNEPFQVVAMEEAGIPRLDQFRFSYSRQAVVVAAKPHFLRHLLDRGFHTAVFLDADILVLNDLTALLEQAGQHALTLTPHLLGPLTGESRSARERNILCSGVFNGGFAAVTESPGARAFLGWWQDRLRTHCIHDPRAGYHYDQRWLDFAPAFTADFSIVCDPGCNVAYWNLPERQVRFDGSQVTAGGVPCRFFHFSGFDPDRPAQVTRYWPRITMEEIGPAAEIFRSYVDLLEQAGYFESCTWPYNYDRFDDGIMIPGIARHMYREMGDEAARFGDPVRTGPGSFFEWLNEPWGGVTRIWRGIYRRRTDVQLVYPDPEGVDRERFRQWVETSGAAECGIPAVFARYASRPPQGSETGAGQPRK